MTKFSHFILDTVLLLLMSSLVTAGLLDYVVGWRDDMLPLTSTEHLPENPTATAKSINELIVGRYKNENAFNEILKIIDDKHSLPTCYKHAYIRLLHSCSSRKTGSANDIDRALEEEQSTFAANLAVCDIQRASDDAVPGQCRYLLDHSVSDATRRNMLQGCITDMYNHGDGDGEGKAWATFVHKIPYGDDICHAARLHAQSDAVLEESRTYAKQVQNLTVASYDATENVIRAQQKIKIMIETDSMDVRQLIKEIVTHLDDMQQYIMQITSASKADRSDHALRLQEANRWVKELTEVMEWLSRRQKELTDSQEVAHYRTHAILTGLDKANDAQDRLHQKLDSSLMIFDSRIESMALSLDKAHNKVDDLLTFLDRLEDFVPYAQIAIFLVLASFIVTILRFLLYMLCQGCGSCIVRLFRLTRGELTPERTYRPLELEFGRRSRSDMNVLYDRMRVTSISHEASRVATLC